MSKKTRRVSEVVPAVGSALTAPVPWWREILREPVALGLIPVILLRPFSDGPTYPTNNLYFVVGVMALLAVWGVRMLLRGEPIRFATPMLLLLAFWVVAIVTAASAVQFDATYRTIVIWAGHLGLFFIILNGVRTRTGIGIVLTAFMAVFFVEAAWSLMHMKYILPFVRDSVMHDPGLRKAYFGSTELDPELIHRLEVNRAFGSLLFPNALGAFLIMGIPYAAAGTVTSIRTLLKGGASSRDTSPAALIAGGVTWVITLCVSFFVFTFIASFKFPLPRGFDRSVFLPLVRWPDGIYHADTGVYVVMWVSFVALLPLIAGGAVAYVTRKHGLIGFGRRFRAVAFPVTLLVMLRALWLTYSRGSFVALAAAILFVAAILLLQRSRRGKLAQSVAASIAALMVFATLFAAFAEQGAPPPSPPAQQAQQPQPGPAQPGTPPEQAIRTEGINLTAADLMNPASFMLRLTYWQTGLAMAADNPWTGVGLGNFGTVYPKYQPLTAGPVRAAHNDYLQAFCETGIFGGLLFCAFWAYFVFWGARRLLRESDATERWMLGGIYLGVLAFLFHSFVDFNFFNPALAFFGFLLAGVFFARSGPMEGVGMAKKSKASQVLSIPILIAASVITGMAVPVYLCDFIIGGHSFVNVGDDKKVNAVYDAGLFFFRALGPANEPGKVAVKDIETVSKLISNRKVVESFGILYVPTGDNPPRHRQLRPDETVPADAFLAINNPQLARQKAAEFVDAFLKHMAVIDSIFPYSPQWAAYFVQWYDMLASTSADPEQRQRYAVEFLRWAEAGVKRSPEQAIFREWYGKALWLRGNVEKGPGRRAYFEKGLEEYKKATELYPISSDLWQRYGEALIKYGEAMNNAGDKTSGEAYIAQGREARRYAEQLEKAKPST